MRVSTGSFSEEFLPEAKQMLCGISLGQQGALAAARTEMVAEI
jgi:hypothetical protein